MRKIHYNQREGTTMGCRKKDIVNGNQSCQGDLFIPELFKPFALDVKGGEMEMVLPSMPKGEIVGNMAKDEDCH